MDTWAAIGVMVEKPRSFASVPSASSDVVDVGSATGSLSVGSLVSVIELGEFCESVGLSGLLF